MYENRFNAVDENGKVYIPDTVQCEHGFSLIFKKETLEGVKQLRLLPELAKANAGDEGFFIIPRHVHMSGDLLVRFEHREDTVYEYCKNGYVMDPIMSCYGIQTPDISALVRIERNYKYWFSTAVKDGIYSVAAVIDFTDDNPLYDDIRVEIVFMAPDATLGDFAAMERNLRLERDEIIPLTEKTQKAAVEYARKYPLIRIRMGWKQSPSPVVHQTPENEPEMHAVVTFARVRDIADALKAHGVEGAELQLVGWNKSGHDGRFPQLMPPEEKLGGMEELKKTIAYVKSLGYTISLHTNNMGSVEIAETFTWDDAVVKPDGNYFRISHHSGGYSYLVCPEKQLKNAKRDLPEVAQLGLNGVHFSDALSIILPRTCFSKNHPSSLANGLVRAEEYCHYVQELFGGFSSEGCMDFCLKYLDYGLYVTFGDGFNKEEIPVSHALVPFFELAYHGVVMYSPTSPTINYPLKHPADQLAFWMRGGRPSFYFHSKFRYGDTNWMGENDLIATDNASMERAVSMIAKSAAEYAQVADLQLVYMKDYVLHGNGIEEAVYCDGTRMIGNFSDRSVTFRGKTLEPWGWVLER